MTVVLPDTLNYYLPDAALNLGSAITTVNTATFKQTEFDTFSLAVNSSTSALVDEIRFGASYDDVIGAGGSGTSDYETWATGYPGLGLPGGDDDGDGLTNDEERLWGLDPTRPASVNPIVAPFDVAAGTFSYTRRDPALTGLVYEIWTSTDLTGWSEDTGAAQNPDPADANGVQTVEVSLGPGLPASPRRFVRVSASGTGN